MDSAARFPLLKLTDVHTHIGRYHILHGVSLAVPEGRVTMLLGRNGAGKTTTLRTIMGLWRTSGGGIAYDNAPIERSRTPDIARLGIAYVPESTGIFAGLTVRENLLLGTGRSGFDDQRLHRLHALFPVLRDKWHQAAGLLSGGQKQMLAIGRALIEPRRLILVDEPTKGLAPSVIDQLIEAFLELKRQRTTILLVEQNFHMARALGDEVAVMDDGRIVHAGCMADLAADAALQTRLLGFALGSYQ
jgi:branched-chain amino acid transport system ATP-binding protein